MFGQMGLSLLVSQKTKRILGFAAFVGFAWAHPEVANAPLAAQPAHAAQHDINRLRL
jgi:hypothetical protein